MADGLREDQRFPIIRGHPFRGEDRTGACSLCEYSWQQHAMELMRSPAYTAIGSPEEIDHQEKIDQLLEYIFKAAVDIWKWDPEHSAKNAVANACAIWNETLAQVAPDRIRK